MHLLQFLLRSVCRIHLLFSIPTPPTSHFTSPPSCLCTHQAILSSASKPVISFSMARPGSCSYPSNRVHHLQDQVQGFSSSYLNGSEAFQQCPAIPLTRLAFFLQGEKGDSKGWWWGMWGAAGRRVALLHIKNSSVSLFQFHQESACLYRYSKYDCFPPTNLSNDKIHLLLCLLSRISSQSQGLCNSVM